MSQIKRTIKKLLPKSMWIILKKSWNTPLYIYEFYLISTASKMHQKALERVRRKKRLKVVFFLIHESVWKYEGLYYLMDKDDRFEPIVVICPDLKNSGADMAIEMNRTYSNFIQKGYNAIQTYDESEKKWLDVKTRLKPDFVFYTNPNSLTKKEYLITNFPETLTFYVPYGFMITDRPKMQFDMLFHNLVYKVFHESAFHHEQAKKYSRINGRNSIVTGYPGIDTFIFQSDTSKKTGKNYIKRKKKVIWAPHHTIEKEETSYNYSCFLEYSQFILDLTELYKNVIDFVFKPHPILKSKLKKADYWGKEKTETYYKEWEIRSNCELCEGDYSELFLNADAMIHDSGSFLVEFISMNKPSLYMIRNDSIVDGFSELGKQVIDCHYKSFTKDDVTNFIEKVIIEGYDTLEGKRRTLIEYNLHPPNGKRASENIFDEVSNLVNE